MLFHSAKPMCSSCYGLFRWMLGLSFIAVGVVGVLQQLAVFMQSPWGWTLSIIALVWGLVVLFNVGCKECNK